MILVCTYRETILPSHQEEIENNTEVTITICQSQEADQRLIRHTLHCLSSYFPYDKIVIHTIDIPLPLTYIPFKCFSLC